MGKAGKVRVWLEMQIVGIWQYILSKWVQFIRWHRKKNEIWHYRLGVSLVISVVLLLIAPSIMGPICAYLVLYLVFVHVVPWHKISLDNKVIRFSTHYIATAILVVVIALPSWNFVSDRFPNTNNPYKQVITTATAQANVTITSSDYTLGHKDSYPFTNVIIAFSKTQDFEDENLLLILHATSCNIEQTSQNELTYSCDTLNMLPISASINKPVSYLSEVQSVMIKFAPIPAHSFITKGSAYVIINNNVVIQINIPYEQIDENGYIVVIGRQSLRNLGQ